MDGVVARGPFRPRRRRERCAGGADSADRSAGGELGRGSAFRALRQNVLDSSGYNPPIGEALGVIGAEMTRPDFGALKPRLKPKVSGNAVLVGWSWDGNGAFLDMIRLEVDRGDGKGFVLLAMDTTPNYTDTAPFPATPAKWTYRAMYYVGDNGVGQWSDPASVMVGA